MARVWVWSSVATVVALAARLAFPIAWHDADQLSSRIFYAGDALAFLRDAVRPLQSTPAEPSLLFHPPGWPWLLRTFLRAIDAVTEQAVHANAMWIEMLVATISALAVGTSIYLTNTVGGHRAMQVVAIIAPLQFGHLVQGTVPTSEALYSLLIALIAVQALNTTHSASNPRLRVRWFLLGVGAACTSLVRAEFLLATILLAGYAWRSRRRHPEGFALLWYGLGVLLVIVPNVIGNWESIGRYNERHRGTLPEPLPRFAVTTNYGPFNFANANHETADGGMNLDALWRGATTEAELRALASGTIDPTYPSTNQLFVHGYRIGLEWIVRNPAATLTLIRKKTAIASRGLSHGYGFDNWPVGVNGTRRRVDELDPDGRALWALNAALLIGGLVILRRSPSAPIMAIVLAPLVVSTVLFYGYVRLTVAYLPVLWVAQGIAISTIYRALRLSIPVKMWAARCLGVALLVSVVRLAMTVSDVRLLRMEVLVDERGRPFRHEAIRIQRLD